jgi:hypothetical protein
MTRKYLPEVPDNPPDEELTGHEMHDRWEQVTNMDAQGLRYLKQSERNERYLERNSDEAQERNEPLNDAIRLAETPASQWEDEDDGFNEVKQAEEALNFIRRTAAQGASQDKDRAMIEDERPHYGKQEMSLARWALDPFPEEDGW